MKYIFTWKKKYTISFFHIFILRCDNVLGFNFYAIRNLRYRINGISHNLSHIDQCLHTKNLQLNEYAFQYILKHGWFKSLNLSSLSEWSPGTLTILAIISMQFCHRGDASLLSSWSQLLAQIELYLDLRRRNHRWRWWIWRTFTRILHVHISLPANYECNLRFAI